MLQRLLRYFLQGLILAAPVAITFYIIVQLFQFLDGVIPVRIPGLGLLLTLGLITAIGFVTQHFISDRLQQWIDRALKRTPLVSIIYSAVKDLLNAFVGDKRSFKKPVLVKLYENSAIRRLGFVTNDNFDSRTETGAKLLTVYCPHSYNISGNLYLVPEDYVEYLPLNATDVMKYTVSGGVTEIQEPSPGDESRADQEA